MEDDECFYLVVGQEKPRFRKKEMRMQIQVEFGREAFYTWMRNRPSSSMHLEGWTGDNMVKFEF